ncbi:MAG TPA: energy transducer TonB [Vicinamibacterales bacterium]|nr:energy transducer TonB [Vicinamibacterales bacterium]
MFIPEHRSPVAADVYSAREIATAAGVAVRLVRDRIAAGLIPTVDGTFVAEPDAAAAVRALTGAPDASAVPAAPGGPRELLSPPIAARRHTGLPLALSSTLHVAAVLLLVAASSMGLLSHDTEAALVKRADPARLVFLMKPGPGGGGGGGGMRQKTPPPKIQIRRPAPRPASTPIPIRKPPPVSTRARVDTPPSQPPVRPVMRETTPIEMPKPAPAAPAVAAPVVSAPADAEDRAGTLDSTANGAASSGAGTGGGAGTGSGTGMGEGDGAGIGPGSGGGTGGGPYRPGSGIDPPSLLREVKPQYTDQARRQGVEGDVVLEIVVRRDGSVGDIRVLRRLGAGLDQKAIDAVRQWRFSPARRMGAPVDVVVEVAVEFKLR